MIGWTVPGPSERSPENRRESRPDFAELRRRIAALEGGLPFNGQLGPAPAFSAVKQGPEPVRLSFGLEGLDALFAAGGLACGSLHEVVSAESRNAGALSGVALALLAKVMAARSGAVLWVLDPLAGREAGLLHGPGLLRFGVDPARLIAVRPRRTEELLWAMEEGARASVLAAVVGEVQGAQKTLVLLTDGVANLPGSASEARGFALDQAQYAANSNYAIAAISLGANVDTDLMQQIADTTGGVHFHVPGGQTVADYEADLTDVFRQIARERPLRLVR